MTEFSLAQLATVAGLAGITIAMVEITKFLLPWKIDPRIYCAAWALLLTITRLLWVVPPTGMGDIFAAFVNWVMVSASACGGFEFAVKPVERFILQRIEARKQGDGTTDEAG